MERSRSCNCRLSRRTVRRAPRCTCGSSARTAVARCWSERPRSTTKTVGSRSVYTFALAKSGPGACRCPTGSASRWRATVDDNYSCGNGRRPPPCWAAARSCATAALPAPVGGPRGKLWWAAAATGVWAWLGGRACRLGVPTGRGWAWWPVACGRRGGRRRSTGLVGLAGRRLGGVDGVGRRRGGRSAGEAGWWSVGVDGRRGRACWTAWTAPVVDVVGGLGRETRGGREKP